MTSHSVDGPATCDFSVFPTNASTQQVTCVYTTTAQDTSDLVVHFTVGCPAGEVNATATVGYVRQAFCTGAPTLACHNNFCNHTECSEILYCVSDAGVQTCSVLSDCSPGASACSNFGVCIYPDGAEGCSTNTSVQDHRNCDYGSCCGNGLVEGAEECDDGNNVNDDGCDSECRVECGNGQIDGSEECDDGNTNDLDACRNDCTLHVCGDGVVAEAEGCDDNNTVSGDGCSDECVCENKVCLRTNYQAQSCAGDFHQSEHLMSDCFAVAGVSVSFDDGCFHNTSHANSISLHNVLACGGSVDHIEFDNCNTVEAQEFMLIEGACPAVCGDGLLSDGETCDDGNDHNGDGCASDCTCEVIHSSVALHTSPGQYTHAGEQLTITVSFISNIPVDTVASTTPAVNLTCDDTTAVTQMTCTGVYTVKQSDLGPSDLHFASSVTAVSAIDGCNNTDSPSDPATVSYIPDCGNNYTDAGEECDDGNTDETDGCTSLCTVAVCGNGVKEDFEYCDLGGDNSAAGPCSESCTEIEAVTGCTYTQNWYEVYEDCSNPSKATDRKCFSDINTTECAAGCENLRAYCDKYAIVSGANDANCDSLADLCTSVCNDAAGYMTCAWNDDGVGADVCVKLRHQLVPVLLNQGVAGASVPHSVLAELLAVEDFASLAVLESTPCTASNATCSNVNYTHYAQRDSIAALLTQYNCGNNDVPACAGNPECIAAHLDIAEGQYDYELPQGCWVLNVPDCPEEPCHFSVLAECNNGFPEMTLHTGSKCKQNKRINWSGMSGDPVVYRYPSAESAFITVEAGNPCFVCGGEEAVGV